MENIELLTRYGAEGSEADLDKLGGVGWQNRKARLKKRIRDMAEQLIKTAAARLMRKAPELPPPAGLYDEFAARFPYEETDDQMAAIDATIDDLVAGRPMDRLICGDVGFGKTEVALRAAFVAAMNGKQVAVVVPTTLLARQHTKTFAERFRGLPIEIGQASRLVGAAELARVKKGIADGTIDIVIGTHALLGKAIEFSDLGLLIVDEEQHFGVKHKERLKELRAAHPRADALRHADPAHAAAGADRRARSLDDRHAAGRPAGGPHLHLALRSADDPRGAAARAAARRPELLRRAAHLRSRRDQGVPRRQRAGGEGRRRARADAGRPGSTR